MKTVKVKYLLDNADKAQGKIVERFLIETHADIQEALDNKIIGVLHLDGMRKLVNQGKQIILNDKGGYTDTKGTWEIIEETLPLYVVEKIVLNAMKYAHGKGLVKDGVGGEEGVRKWLKENVTLS